MISAAIMQRLSALDMPAEAFREVLSIIAELQSVDDTRREGQRLRTRKHRVTLQQRDGDVAGNVTEPQERSPTPPKEIISNLLPFSKEQVRKQERSEIVALGDWPRNYRDQFWAAYPKKVGKSGALRVLDRVRKSGNVTFVAVMAAIERYRASGIDPQFVKHPETWLNKGCWDDDTGADPTPAPRKGVYVEFSDPARDAWDAYGRANNIKYPVDKRGGWEFPTRWPPGYGESDARNDHADPRTSP